MKIPVFFSFFDKNYIFLYSEKLKKSKCLSFFKMAIFATRFEKITG